MDGLDGPALSLAPKKFGKADLDTGGDGTGVFDPLAISSNRPFDGVGTLEEAVGLTVVEGALKSSPSKRSICELDRLFTFGKDDVDVERLLLRGGGAKRDGNATGLEDSMDSKLAISSFFPAGPFRDKRSTKPGSGCLAGAMAGTWSKKEKSSLVSSKS
jgi:hypothetical protein